MKNLPIDQDNLLKEYHEIELLEKRDVHPEQDRINLMILLISALLGILMFVYFLSQRSFYLIPFLVISVSLVCIGLYLAYKRKSIGYFISTTSILMINFVTSYLMLQHHSDFITLLDGLVIFTFANQLQKPGYLFGAVMITVKMIAFYIIFPGDRYQEHVVATIVNANVLGVLPLLLKSISLATLKAKKQKIRAQMLSFQNQELSESWGKMYSQSIDN
jgi:hypothetical protein